MNRFYFAQAFIVLINSIIASSCATSEVAEIKFEKGASRLSPANQKRIEEAVATAQAKGKLPMPVLSLGATQKCQKS